MRPLALSIGISLLVPGFAWAQTSGGGSAGGQLPVGQSFKNFEFPLYQESQLKATITAVQATGITLNRADTSDLKIDLYDNGAVTTTITSPRADLYVAEKKMRTKNTVHIVRTDADITAQTCDFDLNNKKYILREKVKVILKNFDVGGNGPRETPLDTSSPGASTTLPVPAAAPRFQPDNALLFDSPGAYANTNAAPLPPSTK